jgi:hypothetical protein
MNHEANSDKSNLWCHNHRKIAHDRNIHLTGLEVLGFEGKGDRKKAGIP